MAFNSLLRARPFISSRNGVEKRSIFHEVFKMRYLPAYDPGALPWGMLAVFIAVMSVVGTFAIRGNFADVMVMCILGTAMYFGRKLGFPTAPAVLGIVLGRLAEEGLTQSPRPGEDSCLISLVGLSPLFSLF